MKELPDYLGTEERGYIRRAAMLRRWGNLNVYTCEKCGAQLVTTDVDEGTTPFTTRCRADGCDGYAVSAMYRVHPQAKVTPTHAWYRPATLRGLDPGTEDHVRLGGLILRELTAEELAVFAESGAARQ